MKRVASLVLMTALLLFASVGCASIGNPRDAARDILKSYAEANSVSITADISADYGDKVFDFRLKYDGTPSSGTLTVLKPDAISGITAQYDGEGFGIAWDNVRFETGPLADGALSPAQTLPIILEIWTEGYVFEAIKGSDTLTVTMPIDDNCDLITVFDTDSQLPLRAEITYMGTVCIFAEFFNVIIE